MPPIFAASSREAPSSTAAIVLLTRLYEGQNATVLTLPTQPKNIKNLLSWRPPIVQR